MFFLHAFLPFLDGCEWVEGAPRSCTGAFPLPFDFVLAAGLSYGLPWALVDALGTIFSVNRFVPDVERIWTRTKVPKTKSVFKLFFKNIFKIYLIS